ncbi:toxin-antitoxin system YwqK family antitoxin [Alkaliphilus crotonatoxidans]
MEEGGNPITGLVFERYINGNINYYSYYKNGIQDGECVNFYETGEPKRYCIMRRGQILGKNIVWYKNGNIKLIEYSKYGIVCSYEKFDEQGNMIDRKIEPNNVEKTLLEKYKKLYERSE